MDTPQSFYCPGCGVAGGNGSLAVDTNCNASSYCWELYQKLILYTFPLGDEDFIHQHVIDAYTAQHSSNKLRGIQICFALIGLYLFLEHGYSGKRVQKAHRQLAEKTKGWPQIIYAKPITGITVLDVLSLESEDARIKAVREWSRVVWEAWRVERTRVVGLYTAVLA